MTCFLNFNGLSDSQLSIDRGIRFNFECWKVFHSIIYGSSLANDRLGSFSLIFLILKNLFISTVLHTLDQLATWSSVEMLFYSFKCELNSKS